MIVWKDLRLPPINLWTAPRLLTLRVAYGFPTHPLGAPKPQEAR